MKLDGRHLCYSLNVFPSDADVGRRVADIGLKFGRVRESLGMSEGEPFALGFWSDSHLTGQMADKSNISLVRNFLESKGYYVFTLNAFPYGEFHGKPVKSGVYLPDWTSALRADFTCRAADFLAEVKPPGICGSISTLPGGYTKFLSCREECEKEMARNLIKVADYLAGLEESRGAEIVLSVEMEPDCIWEDCGGFLEFYDRHLRSSQNARRHIGVCYDTSHQELTGYAPGEGLEMLVSGGVRIGKIQLSAALETLGASSGDLAALQPFAESVYLHQTRVKDAGGGVCRRFDDIPRELDGDYPGCRIVSHFHVPVFCSGIGPRIRAARSELLAVLEKTRRDPGICTGLEIETYTYNVLPESLKSPSVEESIAREFKWVADYVRSGADMS